MILVSLQLAVTAGQRVTGVTEEHEGLQFMDWAEHGMFSFLFRAT